MHKNHKKSYSSSKDENKNRKKPKSSSSEESEKYEKEKKSFKVKNSKKNRLSSSSSVSSDCSSKKDSAQHKKSQIATLAAVQEKIKDLGKLLNNPNNILMKKEQEIKKIITFLSDNKCKVSVKISNIQPHPKICAFCNKVIDENYIFAELECCPNKFVHKGCIVDECISISPDLKESELNSRLPCKACKKSFFSFQFLKDFLQDKMKEIKNRRKPCINCEEGKPLSELIKKSCDHFYCQDCLKKLLSDLVIATEIKYDSIKCRSMGCDALLFKENDFKTQFREKYYKADDYYAKITEIKKHEILKRCIGQEDCPRFIKNSPKPNYICLDCENKFKNDKGKKEKQNLQPPMQE